MQRSCRLSCAAEEVLASAELFCATVVLLDACSSCLLRCGRVDAPASERRTLRPALSRAGWASSFHMRGPSGDWVRTFSNKDAEEGQTDHCDCLHLGVQRLTLFNQT